MGKNTMAGGCTDEAIEHLVEQQVSINYQRLETVLVIEDQEDLSKALSIRLQAAGLNVACAYDGIAGLEKIRLLEPDIIILDLCLPRMHGFRLLHEVRRQHNLAHAPIIIVTGDPNPEIEARASRSGIRKVFRKPVALRRVVDEVLDTLNEG